MRTAKQFKVGQLLTSLIGLVAWFAIFNHCALGAFVATRSASVPSHCASHQTPAEQQKGEEMPCCKTLQAVVAPAKANVGYDASDFVLKEYPLAAILLAAISAHDAQSAALDTGPPGAVSFSESVLQRSIFAHAPPVLA